MKKTITTLCLSLSLLACQAQESSKLHTELVTELAHDLKENYVFEKEATAMHDLLLHNLANGKYEAAEKGKPLAEAIHNDLRSIVNDKHLRVRFGNRRPANAKFAGRTIKRLPQGIGEVEIREGNIGYLELTGFTNPNDSYKKLLAEIAQKLSGTKAIILDLRHNGGGSPAAVRLLSSYLFPVGEEVHLNSLYFRNRDSRTDFYTYKSVDGPRLDEIPVYILTSDFTFSAGEEFTYNLKHLERATIVGETTGGGAHPVNMYSLPEEMTAIIPVGRAINPITKTNWEGVGVIPHYQVDEEEALEKALELIKVGMK
jgi:C-terminal processing protease CtpA/Prc